MREGELEIVTRFAPDAQDAYDRLLAVLTARHGEALFSTGPTLDDLVGAALADGHTIATAESCTGGLLAARLTARAGSSAYVLGGITAYANSAKEQLVGVPAEMLAEHGAVSPEVAVALAEGARNRFGAAIGVGITGIAGPGRWDGGQAGGHGAHLRRRARRAGGAGAAPARLADGGAGTIRHDGDAPAAPPAPRRPPGLSPDVDQVT